MVGHLPVRYTPRQEMIQTLFAATRQTLRGFFDSLSASPLRTRTDLFSGLELMFWLHRQGRDIYRIHQHNLALKVLLALD